MLLFTGLEFVLKTGLYRGSTPVFRQFSASVMSDTLDYRVPGDGWLVYSLESGVVERRRRGAGSGLLAGRACVHTAAPGSHRAHKTPDHMVSVRRFTRLPTS